MRRTFGLTALVLASLAAVLIAAEIALRLGSGAPTPRPAPKPDPALAGLPALHTIPELSQPNVRGVNAGVLYRTNSLGLRGQDRPLRPRPGVFRIGVIGDSVTMGHGVDEDAAYPAVLERLLRADEGGRRYEVINMGLSGLNLRQAIVRLARIGMRYRPDLVIYGFTLNDLKSPGYEMAEADAEKRYFALVHRYDDSSSLLLRALWPRWVHLRNVFFPIEGSYLHTLEHNYRDNPDVWNRFVGHLGDLRDVAESRDACTHVFIHAHPEETAGLHPYGDLYDQVEAATREQGLSVTQSIQVFRGHPAADLRRSSRDAHPNAFAHELMGQALHEGLRVLPEECWKRSKR